jgi:N-acetyl-alpha-D-muramate 1-phosphate uridylyltransferase
VISDERETLLETGGGLAKARDAGLLPDPVFCSNADSIWLDGPRNAFADLSAVWDAERMDALLLLVPHNQTHNFTGPGDFYMDGGGRLSRKLPSRIAPFIFTGIQLLSHRLLRDAPEGRFSTNVLWDRAIGEGRLYGAAFTGRWIEVGRPEHVKTAAEVLRGG